MDFRISAHASWMYLFFNLKIKKNHYIPVIIYSHDYITFDVTEEGGQLILSELGLFIFMGTVFIKCHV